jgi:polygalacturonase
MPSARAGDRVAAERPHGTRRISVVDFGAKGDGKTDDRAAIQKAFDYAKANGKDVFIPEGTFLHSGTLTASGIHVFGAGEASILKASTYGKEALFLKGNGVSLTDLHLIGVGGSRLSSAESQKVVIAEAQHFAVERVHVEGTTTGGIMMIGAGYGHIADNVIERTHADSIHMTHATHDVVVERNRVMYSGDDGIAVVSYGGAGDTPVRNITIIDNEVMYNTWGRGITVAGGSNVLIEHNSVAGGTADRAGIYIASGEYNTQAVHNVRVTGNTLTDAGGSVSGHGAITIYNPGGLLIDTLTISNNDIFNPRKAGILVAGGGPQSMAIHDNRLSGGRHGLLANIAVKATISTTSPVDAGR